MCRSVVEHVKSGSDEAHRLVEAAADVRLKPVTDDQLFDDDVQHDSTHSLSSLSDGSGQYGTFGEYAGAPRM